MVQSFSKLDLMIDNKFTIANSLKMQFHLPTLGEIFQEHIKACLR